MKRIDVLVLLRAYLFCLLVLWKNYPSMKRLLISPPPRDIKFYHTVFFCTLEVEKYIIILSLNRRVSFSVLRSMSVYFKCIIKLSLVYLVHLQNAVILCRNVCNSIKTDAVEQSTKIFILLLA